DGEDLVSAESTDGDLVGDPPGDRRRLARPGPGEDADRPAHRLDGTPLLPVQPVEDPARVHAATLARPRDANGDASVTSLRRPAVRALPRTRRSRPGPGREPRACEKCSRRAT